MLQINQGLAGRTSALHTADLSSNPGSPSTTKSDSWAQSHGELWALAGVTPPQQKQKKKKAKIQFFPLSPLKFGFWDNVILNDFKNTAKKKLFLELGNRTIIYPPGYYWIVFLSPLLCFPFLLLSYWFSSFVLWPTLYCSGFTPDYDSALREYYWQGSAYHLGGRDQPPAG